MRLVEPNSYPYFDGFFIKSCGLKVYHVIGTLYKFTPAGDYYTEIKPGEVRTCFLKLGGFQVARTDSMPNWYVTGSDVAPKIISNTQGESLQYVSDFTSDRQYKRRKDDPYSPLSASDRYALHETLTGKEAEAHPVLPTPLEITLEKSKTISWNTRDWRVVQKKDFDEEIKYLAGMANEFKIHVQ